MIEEKDIKSLKLHEETAIENEFSVLRVIGGYIYKFYVEKRDEQDYIYFKLINTVFVPK
jgi:hypothetical protein